MYLAAVLPLSFSCVAHFDCRSTAQQVRPRVALALAVAQVHVLYGWIGYRAFSEAKILFEYSETYLA